MSSKITDYENNGYCKYDFFFSREYIDTINTVIDSLDLTIGNTVFDENNTGKIKQIQYLHTYDNIFNEIIDSLRPIVEKLLHTKSYKILNMQLFEKHPLISKPTRAHQDNAYFKMMPSTPLTVWISLDDINEDNGCLYYAEKTHLTPTRKHQRYHPHTTFRFRSGVPGLSLCLHEHPEERDTPIITKKGDVLIHNCNTIHRAGKNNTEDKRRRAIGIVFIPDDCKIDPLLQKYHDQRLKEDIELQEYKNPNLYNQLKEQFKYLFE